MPRQGPGVYSHPIATFPGYPYYSLTSGLPTRQFFLTAALSASYMTLRKGDAGSGGETGRAGPESENGGYVNFGL